MVLVTCDERESDEKTFASGEIGAGRAARRVDDETREGTFRDAAIGTHRIPRGRTCVRRWPAGR